MSFRRPPRLALWLLEHVWVGAYGDACAQIMQYPAAGPGPGTGAGLDAARGAACARADRP